MSLRDVRAMRACATHSVQTLRNVKSIQILCEVRVFIACAMSRAFKARATYR